MGVRVREKSQGSGEYWVFINHRGRRTSRRVGSLKAAQKVKEQIEARLKLGQEALPKETPAAPTLEEYYVKFKTRYLDTAVRVSTRDSYDRSFRIHILPTLGLMPID